MQDTRHATGEHAADDAQLQLSSEGDDVMEDEWRDTYEKRKATWKHETSQNQQDLVVNSTQITCEADVEGMAIDGPVITDTGTGCADPDNTTDGDMLAQISGKWTLNCEQNHAFKIVARHAMAEKPEQLLMYLGGPGGTGKSRVVSALRDLFESWKQSRRFRLAAYTGVAANNIGGATLHSLLQLNGSARERSTKTKRDLSAMWDGVDYLFIDKLSMLGCEMLHNVSRALTEAKGNTKAFGGINVILAGDFAQLPPIGDTRLYKDINTTSLGAAATNQAQGKILGRLLWLSFEMVVILDESMRQTGPNNMGFVELLQRLCDGVCNRSNYDVLTNSSLRLRTGVDDQQRWSFAPVIVTNNVTRDAINHRSAEAFAEQTGNELHWYHALDTHRRKPITDPPLIKKLEQQHSGQTKHRLRQIPLAIGMPVAINQNFDVAAGIVNGSHGILKKIRYFTGMDQRRYLKSCVVEIPGSGPIDMPHLPRHQFPILPDTMELKFEHGGSHRKCTIQRKQVPIEPGFAMTVHKAQGQTMEHVIVDLAGCMGTEAPYVMVSRAKSLDGLRVFRRFDIKQITKRRSEELRCEFSRLAHLKWRTIQMYGHGREVDNAKRMIAAAKSKTTTEGKKRKADSEVNSTVGNKKL